MNLSNRLSRLNRRQAAKWLGPRSDRLLRAGGARTIDIATQVTVGANVFRLSLPDAWVSLVEDPRLPDRVRGICSACQGPCEHLGAALSLILEEKASLGLAKLPDNGRPGFLELSDKELVRRELLTRADRARTERMRLQPVEAGNPWTDYIVTNAESGKTYRVALRGWQRGQSYCSCPDFAKNTLGTCKHLLYVIDRAKARFRNGKAAKPFLPRLPAVHLAYGERLEIRLELPSDLEGKPAEYLRPLAGSAIEDPAPLVEAIAKCAAAGTEVLVYPDAERHIQSLLHRRRMTDRVAAIRRDPSGNPLRKSLLKTELLPYQLDGIAFAAGCGRAVLADDMGLGKTIQAIGTAEFLARECGITRVLVVCPASVKSQWKDEIARFCDREAVLVAGGARERSDAYGTAFFTLCNYEQVVKDLASVEAVPWDLIILDEGQRIKNWEAKTSRVIKALRSPYALVLSGTPLENRLEELYSVLEFIDARRLGPAFRFENHFRLPGPDGRTAGYRNLDALRALIAPVVLRRTRAQVIRDLPRRTSEILRVTPTQEQLEIHDGAMRTVNLIVRKTFLTEMDLLRLQKALLICRMAADGTSLVDKKEPGYSSKLDRIAELLPPLAAEPGRKTVLFSEWTTMLSLIEKRILEPAGIGHVRLDGSVPQGKRSALVRRFREDPDCRFFLCTNAGSTGLNLQAADTVVNVDLPWNPAVLEQRIGRVHRMGQKRPVQVYLLVTEGTLEENMLKTLGAKKDLALAALDPQSDVTQVELVSGIDNLKRRLELLLGERPAAPVDESELRRVASEAERLAQSQAVEKTGGALIASFFSFLGAVLPPSAEPDPEAVARVREALGALLREEGDGSLSLRVRIPETAALDQWAKILASLAKP